MHPNRLVDIASSRFCHNIEPVSVGLYFLEAWQKSQDLAMIPSWRGYGEYIYPELVLGIASLTIITLPHR